MDRSILLFARKDVPSVDIRLLRKFVPGADALTWRQWEWVLAIASGVLVSLLSATIVVTVGKTVADEGAALAALVEALGGGGGRAAGSMTLCGALLALVIGLDYRQRTPAGTLVLGGGGFVGMTVAGGSLLDGITALAAAPLGAGFLAVGGIGAFVVGAGGVTRFVSPGVGTAQQARVLLAFGFVGPSLVVLLDGGLSVTHLVAGLLASGSLVVVLGTVLVNDTRRVLVLGPNRSGRRSFIAGFSLAIRDHLDGDGRNHLGTSHLKSYTHATDYADAIGGSGEKSRPPIDSSTSQEHWGQFPSAAEIDDSGIDSLRFRTAGPFPTDVVTVVPYSKRGWLQRLLEELERGRDTELASRTGDWKDVRSTPEGSAAVNIYERAARLALDADAVVCLLPLEDFAAPAVENGSISSLLRNRIRRAAPDAASDVEAYDQYRASRERNPPRVYLDSYRKLRDTISSGTSVDYLVTMGDWGRRYFSAKAGLPRERATVPQFSQFVREYLLAAEIGPEKPAGGSILQDQEMSVVWYRLVALETAGSEAPPRIWRGARTPLNGSRCVIERFSG